MTYSLDQNARAVLLPAFDNLDFADVMEPFLEMGGRSVLVGETRAQYLARAMSKERLAFETPSVFRTVRVSPCGTHENPAAMSASRFSHART